MAECERGVSDYCRQRGTVQMQAEVVQLMHDACRVSKIGYLDDSSDGGSLEVSRTTMTVRVSGSLAEFVAANVGEAGAYDNVSEYIRDLIRRDKERVEREAFERLRAELQHAFAASDDTFEPLTAADVIARNRR